MLGNLIVGRMPKVLVTSCVHFSADLPSLICGFQCGRMQTSSECLTAVCALRHNQQGLCEVPLDVSDHNVCLNSAAHRLALSYPLISPKQQCLYSSVKGQRALLLCTLILAPLDGEGRSRLSCFNIFWLRIVCSTHLC